MQSHIMLKCRRVRAPSFAKASAGKRAGAWPPEQKNDHNPQQVMAFSFLYIRIQSSFFYFWIAIPSGPLPTVMVPVMLLSDISIIVTVLLPELLTYA